MSIYAPKYPNVSIRDLYDRALGCYDDIVEASIVGDTESPETQESVLEFIRFRDEIRLGLVAAGLEV